MDKPKSKAGWRTIPLPPGLVAILKEWRLACPKGPLGLVFPNGAGRVESHPNIIQRGWVPTQLAAGVCTIEKDADGKVVLDAKGEPVRKAKYTGLHAIRHFFASWCINPEKAGGRGLQPKEVQSLLGHANIAMTLDVYSHLFPKADDGGALAAAEKALLG
jgi:integrase